MQYRKKPVVIKATQSVGAPVPPPLPSVDTPFTPRIRRYVAEMIRLSRIVASELTIHPQAEKR